MLITLPIFIQSTRCEDSGWILVSSNNLKHRSIILAPVVLPLQRLIYTVVGNTKMLITSPILIQLTRRENDSKI